jgi:EmrB/QacA subfamily drug resistance transporter
MKNLDRAQGAISAPEFIVPVCAPEHRRALLWAAILASSMGFIDSSVTAIAMSAIRLDLGASLEAAQWVGSAYLLALSALILTGGALGDRFGTARMFGLGILLFTLASLACAAAPSSATLIAARGAQGMAAALMVPGSMALIGRAYPREQRGAAIGLWAAASIATTAAGPILGGLALTLEPSFGWRLIFALNLPLGAAALWLLWRYSFADRGKTGVPIDFAGAALASIGLGLLAYGLSTSSNLTLPALIAGTVVFASFLIWEWRAKSPMVQLRIFRSKAFSSVNLATFLLYFAVTGISFYLPMTALSAWGVTPIEVTAAFLPVSVMIALLSAPVGRLADRIGAAPLMAVGSVVVAMAQTGLALTAPLAAFWAACVPLMWLSGFGMALVVAPLTAAVMAAASDAEQGAASGINNAVARAASLCAVALMGRLAAAGYGGKGAELPGFGVTAQSAAHVAATAIGFGHIAFLAAAASTAAALVAFVSWRRPS